MTFTTGLSGNEIFCLAQKGYTPGNIVVGNSVHSLGLIGGIGAGIRALVGGEIEQITNLIEEGRQTAFRRMQSEANSLYATGITGVTSQLIFHGANVEFLSIGSTVYSKNPVDDAKFSTSADGQELFAQLDAGYKPICFAFGNVAYSMGISRGIIGKFKTMARGEINELTRLIYEARENALTIINREALSIGADAVTGVKTYVYELHSGLIEILAIGTAVKKIQKITTESEQLPPQAIVVDRDTFYNSSNTNNFNVNAGSKPLNKGNFLAVFMAIIMFIIFCIVNN